MVKRMLALYPEMQFHVWNLARNEDDAEWVKDCDDNHPRITVLNQFYGDGEPWSHFNDVYRHYANPEFRDTIFLKLDDDDVFIEADRIPEFVAMVRERPDRIISAQVVNNGASTMTHPGLVEEWKALRIPLLNVHLKPSYAEACHEYFFDNWMRMVDQPIKLIDTKDWLSINAIGYGWEMGCQIAGLLDTRPPRHIAGRLFNPHRHHVGDEGAVNMLPRAIMQGFTVCHLYFGPQAKQMTDERLTQLRKAYAVIGQEYLDGQR